MKRRLQYLYAALTPLPYIITAYPRTVVEWNGAAYTPELSAVQEQQGVHVDGQHIAEV